MISKNMSNQWKAIACMMIAVHHYVHLSGIWKNPLGYIVSAHMGYVFVSVFFFLSGYGLSESEQAKPLSWYAFFRRRLVKVYWPFLITNVLTITLYGAVRLVAVDAKSAFMYTFGFKLIDPFCWYVVVTLLLYVFFWISYRFRSGGGKILSLGILLIAYMLIACYALKLPGNIYESVLAFLLGVSLAQNKLIVKKFFTANWGGDMLYMLEPLF